MSKQTDTSLFIVSSVPAFYQRLLKGVATYQELGNRVLRQIEIANSFRQTATVKELANILLHIPIEEYQLAAQYHLVLCKCREKEFQSETLERIAEQSHTLKAKALISRGAIEFYQGDFERALYFYAEALKPNPTIADSIKALTGIATVKAIEGYHASAMRDLERLMPVLKHADPVTYFQLVNAYAMELIEENRLSDAEGVALVTVSSPLGPFYPEWRDTLLEIRSKQKRHSTIVFSQPAVEREYQPEAVVIDNPIQEARIDAVIDYMKENMHEKIRLDQLCRIADLSESRLAHVFKAQTGLPPIEYLIKLRMEKASHLLTTTFQSVKIVMAKVGYGNRHHFLQLFREHFNTTPTAYRKQAMSQRRRY